ncbi:MAG: YjbQ family protein [Desulfovibrio sp.]|nr:YjbQ family protein [Desulfovibrio sp.]MBI4961054.1 YjbQ family protein [Desulfovibrio sp.]
METLTIRTAKREQLLAITGQIQDMVSQNGWKDGMLFLHCPHTTAGLTINENADPDVVRDILATLARLVPERGDYHHAEGNSDAHLKASCMGPGLNLFVENGKLCLGTWQGVFFCEFDGPRTRQLWAKWMGK